jgi:hypothetical protein
MAAPKIEVSLDAPASAFFPPVTPEEMALLPHDDQGPHLVASTWVLVGLATVFLALRVYCKFHRGSRLWWDDYVLVAAWVCLVASGALLTAAVVVGGYGKHVWDVGSQYTIGVILATFLKINVNSVMSITASAWCKTSFALTILRLADGWMRKLVWAIIVLVNVVLGLAALLPMVRCRPISAAWNILEQPTAKCLPTDLLTQYNTFATGFSAATDLVLAFLPWKIIWGLQMKMVEKAGVGVAMSCGVVAAAVTIVKTVKTPQVATLEPGTEHSLPLCLSWPLCLPWVANPGR